MALVNSRFYNTGNPCGGTFGMYIPAVGAERALTPASRAVFHHVSYSPVATAGFRANVGLLNVSAFKVYATIRLYGDAGELLGTRNYWLQPMEYKQLTKIHEQVGTGPVGSGMITVETTTKDARVHTYAMLIDNVSGDPIYMPPDLVPR